VTARSCPDGVAAARVRRARATGSSRGARDPIR
jgi:hypothetical protein